MKGMFQRLMGGAGPEAEPAEPRLTLAVFGKHPAWDDYLGVGVDTGIGVDTEVLAQVKQTLHIGGIRGLVDSGSRRPNQGVHAGN